MGVVNIEEYTCLTDDPFADVRGYVIKYLSEQYPEKDILLLKYVADIYNDRGEARLHRFFLNSTITRSAIGFQTSKEKKEKTEKHFTSLLQGTMDGVSGICRITGKETIFYMDNSFLTGSGTFLNFHLGLDAGIMFSKEALVKFIFVPYGTEMIYDKIGVSGSNIPEIVKYYVNQVIENFTNFSTGPTIDKFE